jgi:N-acetylglucosaminyldiphosphoundecaprenol N-acetyl-beta-D-mannosaminyltransferase
MSNNVLTKVAQRLYLGGEHAIREDWKQWLQRSELTTIFTPNPEQVVLAQSDNAFLKQLLEAKVLIPDGAGLVLAARVLLSEEKSRLGRITGTDLLDWWLGQAEEKAVRTFLLGGQKGVANRLAHQNDPTSFWCKGMHGYENVTSPTPDEERAVMDALKAWSPRVLWVAFGAPYQERWVLEHQEALQKIGVKIVVVCGGAFNYLVGDINRAPKFVQRFGLEWFYRLILEPWRWQRQLRLPIFVYLFAREWVEKLRLPAR